MSAASRLLQTRWLVRAPIVVFRARLGFVFGGRLLLLEHVGRKSKQSRYVALETVQRRDTDHIVVASGFGETAQWYRNLMAEPNCHVSIGLRYRAPAVARELDAAEVAAVLSRYRVEHPAAYRELAGVIEDAIGRSIDDIPYLELALRPR